MEILHEIISRDPSVKVVYNTRDPRAIYSSRKVHERFTPHKTVRKVRDLCVQLDHDLTAFEEKEQEFRGNIYRTTYDDLTKYTVYTVDKIYKWLGVPVPEEAMIKLTGKSLNRKYDENTKPKWKENLNNTEITIINQECEHVIKYLEYDKIEGL